MGITWELVETITKAIVVIGGAGVAIFQLYNRIPKSRTPLVRDIEILKMLDKNDPVYRVVRDSFERRVEEMYIISPKNFRRIRVQNWPVLCFGIALLSIFGIWTYALYRDGSWWAVLTGFLGLGGIGNIMNAFDEKKSEKPDQPHNKSDTNNDK